jgi:hypothetical protein
MTYPQKVRALLGVGLALAAAVAVAQAQVAWSGAGDFSIKANPNGAWSYQWRNIDGKYALMTGKGGCDSGRIDCWYPDKPGPVGYIGLNVSGSAYRNGTAFAPEGVLMMHPGAAGERPVPTWTAPTDGRYRVTGHFQMVDVWPTGVEVFIQAGQDMLLDQVLSTFGGTAQFDLTIRLRGGESVRFSVDRHGVYFNDTTTLKVSVLDLD